MVAVDAMITGNDVQRLRSPLVARNGHGGAVTECPLLGGEAENICSQRVFRLLTLIVALLRDFGAVQQMPSVVKRARCPAAGLPARPA